MIPIRRTCKGLLKDRQQNRAVRGIQFQRTVHFPIIEPENIKERVLELIFSFILNEKTKTVKKLYAASARLSL